MSKVEDFRAYREKMNARILEQGGLVTKRFFALDGQAYRPGALDVKTKELLGLTASLVLRCDDCISYHVLQSIEAGVTRAELLEAFEVGLIVGGSIVIPHLRRAHELLDEVAPEGAS